MNATICLQIFWDTSAFRHPVPAYKHSAAQFLHLRGWIGSDQTHPNSPCRPESDIAVLRDIGQRLGLEIR